MIVRTHKKIAGFSLVEEVVYIGLFIILLLAVVNATIVLATTYRNIQAVRNIEISAITSMDRMVKEIRNGTSVNTSQTTWSTNPGSLMINSVNASGTSATVRFYVTNSQLMLEENGVAVGPLTSSAVKVTNLVFRNITTANSSAVKIEMTLQSSSTKPVTKYFYDTSLLRGSY